MEQRSYHYRGGILSEGISGNSLKWIAIITMFMDHVGAGIVEPYILSSYDILEASGRLYGFLVLNTVLRTAGRIAFPIFCFLLVEGFLHTRDVKKYGLRLLLFSLISELPFDLIFYGSWFDPGAQNVYVTLFTGLMVMAACRRYEYDWIKKMAAVAAGCAAAYVLKCDYDVTGVLLIVILYEFRKNRKYQFIAGGILAAMESSLLFCAGALAFIPIGMYNGTRGRLKLKYFFYWFYPVHLFILYLIQLMAVR